MAVEGLVAAIHFVIATIEAAAALEAVIVIVILVAVILEVAAEAVAVEDLDAPIHSETAIAETEAVAVSIHFEIATVAIEAVAEWDSVHDLIHSVNPAFLPMEIWAVPTSRNRMEIGEAVKRRNSLK